MKTPERKLAYHGLRLDDEVWRELQKMKAHGTINQGLREILFRGSGQPRFGDVPAQALIDSKPEPKAEPVKPTQTFKGPLLKPSERGRK